MKNVVGENSTFGRFKSRLLALMIKSAKTLPAVRKRIGREYDEIMKDLENAVKPYRNSTLSFPTLPEKGFNREKILAEMAELNRAEDSRWKDGFVSGAVYHGNKEHIRFLNRIYALNSQSNPLHSDIWPSTVKYEAEVVSMTAHMLGGEVLNAKSYNGVCGTVTSGGTESILLAVKTYRDWAREKKGITKPEMVVPVTAHAAFEKAAQYFQIRLIRIPVDTGYQADIEATKKALSRNTILLAGSAPTFPHGIIDPINELSELARSRRIGFHTDACLGGFVLPWVQKLGYDIPQYDFRLPGVTSISADTHKYGFSTKGTSVILYRNPELRHYQYFKTTEWPGGLYFSPTILGSRPGALIAACWAAMVSIGEKGYIEATKKVLKTAATIKKGIGEIPELHILGDPLWVIAFGSKSLDIYRIMDYMTKRKWSLNGHHKPSCIHFCVTLRHTEPGVAKRFIEDLKSAVRYVKEHPTDKGNMAPVYGMAATFPDRSVVADLLDKYIDMLYTL